MAWTLAVELIVGYAHDDNAPDYGRARSSGGNLRKQNWLTTMPLIGPTHARNKPLPRIRQIMSNLKCQCKTIKRSTTARMTPARLPRKNRKQKKVNSLSQVRFSRAVFNLSEIIHDVCSVPKSRTLSPFFEGMVQTGRIVYFEHKLIVSKACKQAAGKILKPEGAGVILLNILKTTVLDGLLVVHNDNRPFTH